MKSRKKLLCLVLAMTLCILTLTGCSSSLKAPFTEITWENTLEDVKKTEGELLETLDSGNGETTYCYAKSYKGIDGDAQYTFDKDGKLIYIAWQCSVDSSEELDDIYEAILEETTNQYGDCDYTPPNFNSKANVWYMDKGNISILTISATDVNTLLYTFTHPDVAENPDK